MLAHAPAHARTLALALGLVALLVALPRPLSAQVSSEAVVESRREQAKLSFQRGAAMFRSAQYGDAVKAFLEADRLAPSPALSFNIALSYERLTDTSGALRWYRDYLRRSPGAKNATEVRARVAELAARLARSGVQQLSVLSTPAGASVLIDGRAAGVTPFTGDLKPGLHHVELELEGYRRSRSDAQLRADAPLEVNLTLLRDTTPTALYVRSGPGGESSPNDPGADHAGARRFGPVPWVFLGAGLAGLGVATGFEIARRGDEQDARDAPSQVAFQSELDDMNRNQTRARVFAGIGGGLLLTGGVLLLFNQRVQETPRVGLGCTSEGCAASARGSF